MNKRTYNKKLKNFIKSNINKQIKCIKIYQNKCSKCKNKHLDCWENCDFESDWFRFEFKNSTFAKYINSIIGNFVNINYYEERNINDILQWKKL